MSFMIFHERPFLDTDEPSVFICFLSWRCCFFLVYSCMACSAVRGTPWAMMSCLKSNQKLTSPWLFVSASILESSQMLWKVGSRLFIQRRISPKHTHSISLHGYLSREAQVTVFLKSGRHKSPSAANYNSHPTCWSQRAGGAVFRR